MAMQDLTLSPRQELPQFAVAGAASDDSRWGFILDEVVCDEVAAQLKSNLFIEAYLAEFLAILAVDGNGGIKVKQARSKSAVPDE